MINAEVCLIGTRPLLGLARKTVQRTLSRRPPVLGQDQAAHFVFGMTLRIL